MWLCLHMVVICSNRIVLHFAHCSLIFASYSLEYCFQSLADEKEGRLQQHLKYGSEMFQFAIETSPSVY